MSIVSSTRKIIKKSGVDRKLKNSFSAQYRREEALGKKLIDDVNRRGFETVRQKHQGKTGAEGKYHNLDFHMIEVVREANRLGLLDAKPMRILDIGCGSGCFLFAARSAGHDVLGMDLDETPLYNDTVALLEIPRIVHRVMAMQALPDLGEKFNLITAYSICFDNHHSDEVWGPQEWHFFITDCLTRLRRGGRVVLNFNPATTRDFRFVPDEVAEYLRCIPHSKLSKSKEFFTVTIA